LGGGSDLKNIGFKGADHKSGRLAKKWMRFWAGRSGISIFGRISSRLAAWLAPPHMGQVSLAYMTPNGYIDAAAIIYHSDFHIGQNVYIAPRVVIYQSTEGQSIKLGDKVAIHRDAVLENGRGGYIEIGNKSSVHPGCQLKSYSQPIIVGEGVMIAANVALYSYDHGMAADIPMREQPIIAKAPVIVEDDAWIGTGAIILSGVTIGRGAVVGAGSVVTRNIPANAIAVGNPARVVKYRAK